MNKHSLNKIVPYHYNLSKLFTHKFYDVNNPLDTSEYVYVNNCCLARKNWK